MQLLIFCRVGVRGGICCLPFGGKCRCNWMLVGVRLNYCLPDPMATEGCLLYQTGYFDEVGLPFPRFKNATASVPMVAVAMTPPSQSCPCKPAYIPPTMPQTPIHSAARMPPIRSVNIKVFILACSRRRVSASICVCSNTQSTRSGRIAWRRSIPPMGNSGASEWLS